MLLHWLDILGSICSFSSTVFYVLAWEICWPLGLLATIINGVLYGLTQIYGDMGLEMLYFVSMFYGWYEWRYGGKGHKQLHIRQLNYKLALLLIFISGIGIMGTYWILKNIFHSPVAGLDATTTVLSLIAQWMICVKILECWLIWFLVDAIYIILYFDRHLPIHSLLLFIYLIMAVAGYWRWKVLHQQNQ